jgi:DNA (cytosine-5)-methyltransferase 1
MSAQSINQPAPVITANRKWHYLMNPQFNSAGGSVDKPVLR